MFFLASQFWIEVICIPAGWPYRGLCYKCIPLYFYRVKCQPCCNLKKAMMRIYEITKSIHPAGLLVQWGWLFSFQWKLEVWSAHYQANGKHFNEWKKINDEGEKRYCLTGNSHGQYATRERVLDILENYTLFRMRKKRSHQDWLQKISVSGSRKTHQAFH